MAKGIILLKKPNQTIPQDFLQKVVDKGTVRCMGLACRDNGGISIHKVPGMVDLKGLTDALDACKGHALVHLGEYPKTFDNDDIQPTSVLEDDQTKPLIVSACEGEFVAQTTDSSHLDSWHMTYDYLVNHLDELYDLCGKDMDKLMVALNKESFKKNLIGQIKSSGSIAVMGLDSSIIIATMNRKNCLQADWGWASDSLGWKPKVDAVTVDNNSERQQDKPLSLAERKAQKSALSSAAMPKKIEDANIGTKDSPEHPKIVKGKDGPVTIKIPEKVLKGRLRDIKQWCRHTGGYIPPELEADPTGKIVTDKAQVNWDAINFITRSARDIWNAQHKPESKPVDTIAEKMSEASKVSLADRKKAAAEAKNATVQNVDTGGTEQEATLRVIPAVEKDKATAFLLEAISESEKLPVPAHRIQSEELKYANFSEGYGLELELVKKFTDQRKLDLIKNFPLSTLALLNELLEEKVEEFEPPIKEEKPLSLAERKAQRKSA